MITIFLSFRSRLIFLYQVARFEVVQVAAQRELESAALGRAERKYLEEIAQRKVRADGIVCEAKFAPAY